MPSTTHTLLAGESDRLRAIQRRAVSAALSRFCDDRASRDYGGLVQADTGHADTRNSIYEGLELFAAYLLPGLDEYQGSEVLLRVLKGHLDFIRRRQRPDGTVDMGVNGVGQGCEVGFTLPGACAAYSAASASDLPGADRIAAVLADYIQRGAAAVRRSFPYTANHRWTAHAGPLACAHRLFPHPDNPAVIEDLLEDGIDMDASGLYRHERSAIYDNVANWGLLYLADAWGRTELLDLVARNLRFTLAMLQPCGESETLFSFRQDRGEGGRRAGDYYVLRRMAAHLRDPELAWLAGQRLADLERRGGAFFVPLAFLLHDGRLPLDPVVPAEPVWDVALHSAEAHLGRRREGATALTLAADPGDHFFNLTQGTWGGPVRSDNVLSFHHGNAIVDAFKIRWGSGVGGFRPTALERLAPDAWRLRDTDPGWDHPAHFRRPARQGPYHSPGNHSAELEVRWEHGTLKAAATVGGLEGMPLNLQFLLRPNGRLRLADGTEVVLRAGGQTFTTGGELFLLPDGGSGDGIRIAGLPASTHRMLMPDSRTIPGKAEGACHRLVVATFSPLSVDFTLSPTKGDTP